MGLGLLLDALRSSRGGACGVTAMFGYLLIFWQIRSRGCCRDSYDPALRPGVLQGAPSLSAQYQKTCLHLRTLIFIAFKGPKSVSGVDAC